MNVENCQTGLTGHIGFKTATATAAQPRGNQSSKTLSKQPEAKSHANHGIGVTLKPNCSVLVGFVLTFSFSSQFIK